jgi:glutaredoxin
MNFIVYSKPGCPYCEKVKKVLDLTKQTYMQYTLNVDFNKEDFYLKFGQGSTFPQVICDDKKLGGCVDTVKFLKEQNILV